MIDLDTNIEELRRPRVSRFELALWVIGTTMALACVIDAINGGMQ